MSAELSLTAIESVLDAMPWRVVGRLHAWWRTADGWYREPASAPRPLPDPSEVHGVGESGRALTLALQLGAMDLAAGLFDRLLATATLGVGHDTLLALLEAGLVFGRAGEVLGLARRRHRELCLSSRGATLLTLLNLDAPDWLADGRPNLLAWSRSIERNLLSVRDLARLASRRPHRSLLSPEAQLPFFSALWRTEPTRAVGFLNRYLTRLGVTDRLEVESRLSSNALGALRCTPFARSRGPAVSVIIAARNAEETIEYALKSILAQAHADIELLVGDDASTDATGVVLSRFVADPRVRVFRGLRQQGAYNMRNQLVRRAGGDLLTFHDADDLALASRIECQLASLSAGARASVSSLLRLKPNGTIVFFKNQRAQRLCRASLLLQRRDFEDVGGFRSARVGADEELHARLVERFGRASLHRLKLPLTLSLSSSSSATRALGWESLEDGYRSPARRAYSELLYRRFVEKSKVSDSHFDEMLQRTNNYVEPSEIVEVTSRS